MQLFNSVSWCRFLFSGALVLWPLCVSAHVLPFGTIRTDLTIQENRINLDSKVSQNTNIPNFPLQDERDFYENYFAENLKIQHGGRNCAFKLTSFDPSLHAPKSTFHGVYTCESAIQGVQSLVIHAIIFNDVFQNFEHFVTISIDNKRWNLLFTADTQEYPGSVSAQYLGSDAAYYFAVSKEFIWLGIMHILSGYDHILFLLSIILIVTGIRKILLLVTSFTVAHSITLLLAGFNIVRISPGIVEPLIALSIAYMALRNVWILKRVGMQHEGAISERWAATFGFGLIHGLGFASVLSQASIPQSFFVPSLVIFNLGIEVGQLGILALVLPILWYVRTVRHARAIFISLSFIIAAVAFVWFVQRVV